jgi:hypothetical protein
MCEGTNTIRVSLCTSIQYPQRLIGGRVCPLNVRINNLLKHIWDTKFLEDAKARDLGTDVRQLRTKQFCDKMHSSSDGLSLCDSNGLPISVLNPFRKKCVDGYRQSNAVPTYIYNIYDGHYDERNSTSWGNGTNS